MKLKDVKLDDTPNNRRPYITNTIPKDDKLINVVLSGGYNVQPTPVANSLFIDIIIQI